MSPARNTGVRLRLMDEAAEIRYSAWDRITSPKNVAKGGWDRIPTWRLFAMLLEEAVELSWEVLRGRRERALREAGDLLVVAAMLTERTKKKGR